MMMMIRMIARNNTTNTASRIVAAVSLNNTFRTGRRMFMECGGVVTKQKKNRMMSTNIHIRKRILANNTINNNTISSSTTTTTCFRCFSQKETWNWSSSSSSSSKSSTQSPSISHTATITTSLGGTDDGTGGDISTAKQQNKVLNRCAQLYSALMPINDKLNGPLEQQHQPIADDNTTDDTDIPYNTIIGNNTLLPFVFLVGNHSSGKSSFINYVLGRDVQTAGVAPTDDCFTVITKGTQDIDQDGPALIFGNPELGFAPLRQFGPNLVHHTQLKVRTNINASNFMMIDSPGMIDSPTASSGSTFSTGSSYTTAGPSSMDRGYDFQGVVRWFAERADIVLLFFDPDKPGTTGETLSVLLHSLGGMDHKLLIVLNKADQFKLIHDFARAYGSLCWNLSKVIPRKDLPRIFTMCLPVKENNHKEKQSNLGEYSSSSSSSDSSHISGESSSSSSSSSNRSSSNSPGGGLEDLHATRDDVVAEVMKAPQRRIDNVITHLYDSACLLQMHVKICQDLRQRYRKVYWDCKVKEVGFVSFTMGLGISGTYFMSDFLAQYPTIVGGAVGTSIIGFAGLVWYNAIQLNDTERDMLSQEGLSATFQRCYRREVNEGDEFIASIWQRIRDPLKASIEQTTGGLKNIPSISDSQIDSVQRIIQEDIPSLRRMVSPTTTFTTK